MNLFQFGETLCEHCSGSGIDFAKKCRLVTCPAKAELEAANSGEHPSYPQTAFWFSRRAARRQGEAIRKNSPLGLYSLVSSMARNQQPGSRAYRATR
jgi:hypothetical protein